MNFIKLTLILTIGLTYVTIISCKNNPVEKTIASEKDTATNSIPVDSTVSGDSIIIKKTFESGEPMIIQIPDSLNSEEVYEKQFYKSGNLFIEGSLKNDKRNGKWVAYYESGKIWSVGYFEDGLKQGSSDVYYENGKIRYTKNYVKDVAEGLWKFYTEDGSLLGEVMYEKGEILWQKGKSE